MASVQDESSQETLETQCSEESNKSSKSIFKFGSPIVNQLASVKDLFEIAGARKRMDTAECAKAQREKYLENAAKDGDVHYFKVQTFGPCYKREV